ncbi:BA14K family protein [Mesorhizobium sp. M6A.T.Cr.TU.014.01.1.1]|uniref:BA14K family protein n=1 Tax=unclassified Mesorhizobium TaxID=325217 RepID=UPI000FD46D7F|nr:MULTISPECIES: BA14K family protein [unclassified Mesorhizobium]RVB77552.1 BA14K family protein [Mesorhizobium sp. M6A.T.Cr.TU.014.01.1.1]RWP72959.1 MAG: BA14K family protein [Mesorhizobium sp.]RWQ02969.1 MAG: BA14K family protein [Mesorhizobium sp.]
MKALSAVLGGFVLTLAVFASGLAFAVWILAAEPVRQAAPTSSVAELWPKEPRKVDPASQRLERLPARPVDHSSKPADAAASAPIVTGSIQPQTDEQQTGEQQAVPAGHAEWCASRYRSYRPSDDHYTSYSGEQRPCISPYLDAGAADRTAQPPDDGASYVEASDTLPMDGYVPSQEAGAAWLPPDHVQYCFSRYRSYRPEDNSYQPYSGGPRRQCE